MAKNAANSARLVIEELFLSITASQLKPKGYEGEK
jgi:hypothetical protein